MKAGRLLCVAGALALVVASGTSYAWDGVVTGKISQINGVGGSAGAPGNYDIRVYIEGQTTICAGAIDPAWAYVNSNDANYKGLLALLLMAQASGKTVTLDTNKSASGYCQIAYMSVIT